MERRRMAGAGRMEQEEEANNLRHGRAVVADINDPEILCSARGEDGPESDKQARREKGAAFVRVIPPIYFYVAITGRSTAAGVQCPRN